MSSIRLREGRISSPGYAYHITTAVRNRDHVFCDFHLARRMIAEMRFVHELRLVSSFAWVVMPDHVHWLFQFGEKYPLDQVMKSFKARSALACNRYLNRSGAFWQKGYFEQGVRGERDLLAMARYIVGNPLRKGLVTKVEQYPHWDAIWLW